LESKSLNNEFWVNAEVVIARFWDKRNRANESRPLPVQTIIHEILPGQKRINRLEKGNFVFEGLPYLTRDIMVLNSIVQWFGTSVGSNFLTEDISRWHPHHPEREFLVKFEVKNNQWFCWDPCVYDLDEVSERDRAVADGFMRWLGRHAGREFTAQYQTRLKRVWAAVDEKRRRALEVRRVA
jgi:hypothetical protein